LVTDTDQVGVRFSMLLEARQSIIESPSFDRFGQRRISIVKA
jgi:hypothetical protein